MIEEHACVGGPSVVLHFFDMFSEFG